MSDNYALKPSDLNDIRNIVRDVVREELSAFMATFVESAKALNGSKRCTTCGGPSVDGYCPHCNG